MVGDQMAKTKLNDNVPKLPTQMSVETLERHCYDLLVGMKEDGDQVKRFGASKRETKEKALPFLRAYRTKLNRQGKKDGGDGWQRWFEKNKSVLGVSRKTVERWLDPVTDKKQFANITSADGITINNQKFTFTVKLKSQRIVGLELTPYVKPEVAAEVAPEPQPVETGSVVKIKLTPTQFDEVAETAKSLGIGCEGKRTLVFTDYENQAKALITALGEKALGLYHVHTFRTRRVIEAAIRKLVFDAPDEHDILDWFEREHRDEMDRLEKQRYQQFVAEMEAQQQQNERLKAQQPVPETLTDAQKDHAEAYEKATGKKSIVLTLNDCPTPAEDESEGFKLAAELTRSVEESQ